MSRRSQALSAQTTAALTALARTFWAAAQARVEQRLEVEQKSIERVKLLRPFTSRFTTNTAQTPRAPFER